MLKTNESDRRECPLQIASGLLPPMVTGSDREMCMTVCKALEDVMQSVAAIQSELHVDRVDICTMTELELD